MSLRDYMTPEERKRVDGFFEKNGGIDGMIRESTKQFRGNLSETIMRAKYGSEGTVITHHGKEYAAMVPFEIAEIIEKVKARAEQN